MAGHAHPQQGDGVRILTPNTRLRGQVGARRNGSVTVLLEAAGLRQPYHFAAGTELELEWIEQSGVMQSSARVGEADAGQEGTLELELVGEPEPVERRDHDRERIELEVSGWTLTQATRRLTGTTVDVSTGGALLRLPDLAPHAATLELQVALPDGPVRATAAIRWREEPGLVGVEFTRIDPEHRARLADFLRFD